MNPVRTLEPDVGRTYGRLSLRIQGEAGAVSESETTEPGRPPRSGRGGRTIAIVFAILVVVAIVHADERTEPTFVTTTSAQTAWELVTNGWRCENVRGKPLNLELLDLFAKTEKDLSDPYNQANFFEERPVTCIKPSS